MDIWKYFDITHREHLICNPSTLTKLEHLFGLFHLSPGAEVLELATGKGEFLLQLAEHYQIEGLGIDLSPYCIDDARAKFQSRNLRSKLSFIVMDGADYEPESPESFDLVACIGASWIFGGHLGTLKALDRMTAKDGWIVVGEPYWRQEPAKEYLEAIEQEHSSFGTHYENASAGDELGLELAYTLVSSQDDWDIYEGLQWYAAQKWARENPDDPDVAEVLKRVRKNKAAYLRWGRETLGWAIYVFRKG
jgi:hypothetical protein